MIFKLFRRHLRARARKRRIDAAARAKAREAERAREEDRALREMQYRQKIEDRKDEAFEALCSSVVLTFGSCPHRDAVMLAFRDTLYLNGWQYVTLEERMK